MDIDTYTGVVRTYYDQEQTKLKTEYFQLNGKINGLYKEYYKNEEFIFDKPLLIIHNKYNIEWGDKPYNFISVPVLNILCNMFKNKYQLVYYCMLYISESIGKTKLPLTIFGF